ncbi:hypothetical protein PVAP13_5NG546400 [Panicum virgatum]|uniref:Uncharacterized protein n=1 Tax=Panicum virgatum TaxID=38727 RepID=A0A8T0S5P3_PANVG|nr:hypothetical protein PVAP13_5NG546400 [Panicum virgatum]
MYWQLVLSVPILLAAEAVLTREARHEFLLHKYWDESVGDDGPHATAHQDLHSQKDVNICGGLVISNWSCYLLPVVAGVLGLRRNVSGACPRGVVWLIS